MVTPQRRAVILTALPIERTAVLEHLREHREEVHPRGTVYQRGVFDERSDPWEVLVAEIGAGNEGAAAEVERALDHFNPQVALFVGVAGGIKDLTHGDVVASTKIYNYESGKERTKLFETRPEVESPSYALLQRARAEAGSPDWRQRIRPGGQPPTPALPEAKVGPIAAGPKVLASTRAETFKFVRQHYGDAIAVEMEGHGFLLGVRMNHPVHGIVIRGISDLVGDKNAARDVHRQPIAARNAAAFAFQLLAKLTDLPPGQPALSADLGEDWQRQHLEDARRTAGPRYSSQLCVGTPLHDVFEALCGTEAWFASLQPRGRKLCKAIKHWSRAVDTRDSHTWGAPFPEHLQQEGYAVAEALHVLGNSFVDLTERKEGASPGAAAAAGAVLPRLRELYQSLRQDLESRHGEGTADSAHFRQFEASYQCAFPAANVDAAKELVALLEGLEVWGRSGVGRAAGAKGILLAGVAGAGKTHAICDVAHHRAARGLRTAVLFGEHFKSADEPWDRIRQLLGFGPIARDDLLAALDTAGRESGGPFLLCIDGLNESRPRGYWRDWLSALAGQAARYRNVRLCVSCRSTYEQLIVPEGHGLERVEHGGFAGMENTACREFFEYHGLEPPVAPSFHPEFSNPLFLRLACQTLKAAGHCRMPTGWHGINTALKAFVGEKNKAFAQEYERDERERVPRRAMDEFMGEVERAKKVYLGWALANAAVERARPQGLAGPSILDWLVREGLLITDADPDRHGPDAEDVVRVAFERLGEHLFADRLLGKVRPDGLTAAIESGALAFAFSDGAAVLANRGMVEALSIQIPERVEFALELIDVLPGGAPRDRVLSATVAALPWRDPQHMTDRTCAIAFEALTTPGMCYETFDNLLAIACQETSPDALWLEGLLRRQSMPQRDGFLCGYLHERAGVSSAVDRLLRAPFEVDAGSVPEPVLVRWATILLWFCVAADRRVRDWATKGLVAINAAPADGVGGPGQAVRDRQRRVRRRAVPLRGLRHPATRAGRRGGVVRRRGRPRGFVRRPARVPERTDPRPRAVHPRTRRTRRRASRRHRPRRRPNPASERVAAGDAVRGRRRALPRIKAGLPEAAHELPARRLLHLPAVPAGALRARHPPHGNGALGLAPRHRRDGVRREGAGGLRRSHDLPSRRREGQARVGGADRQEVPVDRPGPLGRPTGRSRGARESYVGVRSGRRAPDLQTRPRNRPQPAGNEPVAGKGGPFMVDAGRLRLCRAVRPVQRRVGGARGRRSPVIEAPQRR